MLDQNPALYRKEAIGSDCSYAASILNHNPAFDMLADVGDRRSNTRGTVTATRR